MKITKRNLMLSLAISILFGFANFDNIAMASEAETKAPDTVKPVINYAYIEEETLKVSISDDEELARKPIIFKIGKESKSYEISINDYVYEYDGRKKAGEVYEIKIEVPSDIFLTIIDYAGNENTYKFTIKEDNSGLTNYIPEFVIDRLNENRQSSVNKFKGFEDILELEYGKVVDAFSLYDNIIKDNYFKYKKADINFKASGLSIDKDGNIKLNKYGIFKITMTHKLDKTFETSAYVLIKPDWKDSEKRDSPSNYNPYIVYNDKIKAADYFRPKDEVGAKKTKIDTTYMLVYNEDTDKTLGMNDQISLELNKTYKLSVLNFEDNSQQDLYLMRQEKSKQTGKDFLDLSPGHWASNDIKTLVSKGVLSGYPDGSFKPKGNITVKEFMTVLSKEIALNPTKAMPVVGDVLVGISPNTWGYIESKSILDRLLPNDLYKFNYINLDRPINREEVAFLINNAFILTRPYNTYGGKNMSDIGVLYANDIKNLVDLDIISGYPDGTFRPKNNITRAEIAALITRIK